MPLHCGLRPSSSQHYHVSMPFAAAYEVPSSAIPKPRLLPIRPSIWHTIHAVLQAGRHLDATMPLSPMQSICLKHATSRPYHLSSADDASMILLIPDPP